MQSPGAKHKTRQKSKCKTSGDYYQFSWDDEELSASDDERDGALSPKEYVARILEETELSDQPIGGHDASRLDLSFDFLPEVTSIASDDVRLDMASLGDVHTPAASYDDDNYTREVAEKLESPLDHPDSGYIEFVMSPSSSTSLDNARSHSDGWGSSDFHSDNESVSSDDANRWRMTRSKDKSKRRGNDSLIPTIRFRKANFSRLDEDLYIDDDMNTEYMQAASSDRHIITPMEFTDNIRSSDAEIGSYLPMQEADITERISDSILDSDEDQEETEIDDTNPIILIDQGKLTQQWRRKRKRIKIVVGVLAVVSGLLGFAAIVYLLVRFLILV